MSRTRSPAISRLANRRALLESLIASLKSCLNVSNAEVRRAVTKNEYAAYRAQLCAIQPSSRKLSSPIVDGIQRYAERLRKADSLHDRAESADSVPMVGLKYFRRPSLYQRAEHMYELALEALEELVSVYPGVASFFDRPVAFNLNHYPTLDPESVPRLNTSRSRFARHTENGKKSPIYRLKLETLQASMTELCGDAEEMSVRIVAADEDLDVDLLPPDANHFEPGMFDDDFL